MPESEIRSLFDTDERNRQAVYASVGAAVTIPDDLVGLYKMHYAAIVSQLSDYPAQIAGALYVACRKHLALGMTSLFRRYSTQAFRETRGATEAAGIANAIRADTECFRISREDNGSVESRKAAKDRFRPGLPSTGYPELVQLKAFYDKASELSHTNRRTFTPHLKVNEGTFSYQDLRQPDIPRLVTNYLLWICRAHLAILEAADVVFKDAEGNLVVEFRKETPECWRKAISIQRPKRGQVLLNPAGTVG